MPRSRHRHLPGEILTDIFLRLPFDSILNCKLVSMEWNNLINHPTFSKNYNGYINSMSLFTDGDRIFCLRIRHDKNKQLTEAGNPPFTVNQLPIASHYNPATFVVYIQISNMIVCVRKDDGSFNFYNLITGSAALHTVTDSHLCRGGWRYYGFGYDAYRDDYKIVEFCYYTKKRHMSYNKTQFWVYSFKNQEWKSYNEFPYSAYISSSPNAGATTVNGVLYWLALRNGVVITYDLHTGVFGEIKLPEVGIGLDCFHDFGLQELNGKLCYTYERKCTNQTLDVWRSWRMVGDSWEMLVSINCATADGKIPWSLLCNCERPLMLHESADGRKLILFFDQFDQPNLHWYDFVNNKCETFRKKVWRQQRIKKLGC